MKQRIPTDFNSENQILRQSLYDISVQYQKSLNGNIRNYLFFAICFATIGYIIYRHFNSLDIDLKFIIGFCILLLLLNLVLAFGSAVKKFTS